MGTLLTSAKERLRPAVLTKVRDGPMGPPDATRKLGLSYRQVRRVRRRHADEGDAGLAHRSRGKAFNREADPAVRDRAGIYRSDKTPTPEQALAGERPATQSGRAMTSPGVELILANGPQAKGRVERMNGTLRRTG